MTLDLESIGLRQVRCNTNTNAVGVGGGSNGGLVVAVIFDPSLRYAFPRRSVSLLGWPIDARWKKGCGTARKVLANDASFRESGEKK